MESKILKVLAVIPARGGSKGIPRKNIRIMNEKPLIYHSIKNALQSKYIADTVVSTDDDEIARISSNYGATVIMRPEDLSTDSVTLDPVIFHGLKEMEKINNTTYDVVITMQPTSPLLETKSLDSAIESLMNEGYDTVISGINKPHLAWTEKDGKIIPKYEKRLNRQYLPKNLMETGAFFISKREFIKEDNRFGADVSIFEISEKEAIDIDTAQDWWIAEKEFQKKNILIRVEGYADIGLGHIYRGLILAYKLIGHNVCFVLSERSDLGIDKIKESNFLYKVIKDDEEILNIIEENNIDILINDIIDTSERYMQMIKETGIRIINFEDLGSGAKYADAVINDLYEKKHDLKNHYWGSKYYCMRDEFLLASQEEIKEEVKEEVKEILIIFGGTDPSNLTEKLLDVIISMDNPNIIYTFILGMGYKKKDYLVSKYKVNNLKIEFVQDAKIMSEYMKKADIAISSQGRTMLELASMGVPTVLLAQNERELHHEFGYLKNGFINLGLGSKVEKDTIKQTIIWLIKSPQIRNQMRQQMNNIDLKKGIQRVLNIILDKNI